MEGVKGDAQVGQVPAQAHALEVGVVGRLDDAVVGDGVQHVGGDDLTGGQIDHAHVAAVHTVAKQEYLKIRGFGVFVHAGLRQIHTAECFDVDTKGLHKITSLGIGGRGTADCAAAPSVRQDRKSSSSSSSKSEKSDSALARPPRGSPSRIF